MPWERWKTWRNFGKISARIFLLQFPGKMAARSFTKNPRLNLRCARQSSLTAAILGARGTKPRTWPGVCVWRVSNAALGDAALVLSSKNWKNIQNGGQRRKINPKSLGSRFSLCYRAGIDAALVKADFFPQVHPPSKIKSNKKFKALRWRLLRWRLTLSDVWVL